jgi:hypothetical protein
MASESKERASIQKQILQATPEVGKKGNDWGSMVMRTKWPILNRYLGEVKDMAEDHGMHETDLKYEPIWEYG